jgi:hypothetical protein
MRLTIVPIDSKVVIDGTAKFSLDLSACGIPQDVHALQWYETEGEIELNGKPKPPNEEIIVLPNWANACVAVWEAVVIPTPQQSNTQPQPVTTGTQPA